MKKKKKKYVSDEDMALAKYAAKVQSKKKGLGKILPSIVTKNDPGFLIFKEQKGL